MTDEEDVAILAGSTGMQLRHMLQNSSSSLQTPITRLDPRRFLAPQRNQGGYPMHGNPGYPPNMGQPYPQFQHPGYQQQYPQYGPQQEYPQEQNGLPENLPGTIPGLLSLPRNEKGEEIVAQEYQDKLKQLNINNPFNMNNTAEFQIPDYSKPFSPANDYSEQFDTVLKEIKLLKRAVNTLTNLLKKSIIPDPKEPEPTTTPDTENASDN